MSRAAVSQRVKQPEQTSNWGSVVFRAALTVVVYLAAVLASSYLVVQPGGMAWIWFPGGVALSVLVITRRRAWAYILTFIFIANSSANLLSGRSLTVSLVFSLVNVLEAYLAAGLLRRFALPLPGTSSERGAGQPGGQGEAALNFRRFSNVLVFLGIVIFIHGLGALAAALVTTQNGGTFAQNWLTWWVAAVLGAAVIVPLVVTWRPSGRQPAETPATVMPGTLPEGAVLLACLAAVIWYLFLSRPLMWGESILPAYLIFPFLIWAALRFDQNFITFAMAFICLGAALGAQNGLGQFIDPSAARQESISSVQLYLLMVIISTLNLNAALVELKLAGRSISKTEAEYRNLFQNASIGIFHALPGAGFVRVNLTLATMLGYASPEEMIASITDIPGQLYVHPLGYEKLLMMTMRQTGWSHAVSQYRRKDGSLVTGRLSIRKVLAADGGLAYLEGLVEDITERKRVEDALRTSERVMKLFVENTPAAVAMFDREMRYMVVSKRYRDEFGLGGQNLTGRTPDEVFPAMPARWKEFHQRCLANEIVKSDEDSLPRADGGLDYVRWEFRPWFRNETEIGGTILLSEVITERKRAEMALIKSETLLNETQAIAKVGGWVYDLDAKSFTWTKEVYRIYGLPAGQDPIDMAGVISAYAPADRPVIEAAFQKAIQAGQPYDLELRFENTHGRHLWVRTRGTPVFENGRLVRVTGTIMDISERKRAEAALVRSEEQLRLAMEASSDGMWDWRCQPNITHYSPSYYQMLNYSPQEFPSTPEAWMELVHPEDQPLVKRTNQDLLENRFESFEIEYRLRARLGGWIWILSRGKTMSRDRVGRPLRVVGTTVDITGRKMVEEALRRANHKLQVQAEANERMQSLLIEQATHDALTGLYNRRFMDDALQREILRSHREGYPVSVLMLDIDHFKVFNDNYGHDAGDQVLVALSGLLRTNIRQSDIACRYGGEEFVVIMPKASGPDARHRAERLCEDFSFVRVGSEGLTATISVGLAVYPQHGASVDELLRAADAALYSAKAAGRNCVKVWVN